MSKNRVEKLESTVAELESTIHGLTDELVEAKERIRVLEAELDTETPTRVPPRRTDERREAAPDDIEAATIDATGQTDEATAETDDAFGSNVDGEGEAEDSGADDIIVA